MAGDGTKKNRPYKRYGLTTGLLWTLRAAARPAERDYEGGGDCAVCAPLYRGRKKSDFDTKYHSQITPTDHKSH